MIRVPFFLLFGFNKGALNQKGQKGTTQEPRQAYDVSSLSMAQSIVYTQEMLEEELGTPDIQQRSCSHCRCTYHVLSAQTSGA